MEADHDSVGEGVIGVALDPLPKQRGQRPPGILEAWFLSFSAFGGAAQAAHPHAASFIRAGRRKPATGCRISTPDEKQVVRSLLEA